MVKRPSKLKVWIPITSSDGTRRGEYEVSDGRLTVRLGSRQKSTRASSTGVPGSMAADADRLLAIMMLSEKFT
jgi:hypothetical protein